MHRGDNRGPDPTISHYGRAGHLRTGSARPWRNTPHLWGPSSPQHGKAGHRCTEARPYLWPPACLRPGPSYSCHISGLWCAPSCVPHRAYPRGLKKLQQDWEGKAFWLPHSLCWEPCVHGHSWRVDSSHSPARGCSKHGAEPWGPLASAVPEWGLVWHEGCWGRLKGRRRAGGCVVLRPRSLCGKEHRLNLCMPPTPAEPEIGTSVCLSGFLRYLIDLCC